MPTRKFGKKYYKFYWLASTFLSLKKNKIKIKKNNKKRGTILFSGLPCFVFSNHDIVVVWY
jgi:hypothetical protein